MNRIAIALLLVSSVLMTACDSKSREKDNLEIISLEEAERNFAAELTKSDTLEVLNLGQKVIDDIMAGKFDNAFDSLVDPTTCRPIAPERAARLAKHYKGEYQKAELDYYSFSLSGINDLKYRLVTAEGSALSIMFNPVKADDRWFLGLKTERTPSKDQDKPLHPMTPIFVNN